MNDSIYECAYCQCVLNHGTMHASHVYPSSKSGKSDWANIIYTCANCHAMMDRQPREAEFVNFLAELLRLHPMYKDIRVQALVGESVRFQADIIAEYESSSPPPTIFFECKSRLVRGSQAMSSVINQIKLGQAALGECQAVMAIPATIDDEDVRQFQSAGIKVWDLSYIAREFASQIREVSHSYYRALLLALINRPPELTVSQRLIRRLDQCTPGRKDCYVYQALVGEIIEYLFTPPLEKPIAEHFDKTQANRRDFIVPNYSAEGFWFFLRQKYEADYLIIDAKNYARKVKKPDVLQLANYLKPYGAGLLGIIVSRNGGDTLGCEHTLREQWLSHRKLILVLDDKDVKSMLTAKSDGRKPEEVLAQKIEQFRLSM